VVKKIFNYNPHTILSFSIVALVIIVFYLRGFQLPGPLPGNTSGSIPVFALTALIIIVFVENSTFQFGKLYAKHIFIFIIFIILSVAGNVIIFGRVSISIVFIAEVFLNIFILIIVYLGLAYINISDIFKYVFLAGVAFSFYIFYIGIFEIDSIRRIGNTELPIGVNHLGHSLSASFVIGISTYYYKSRDIKLIIGSGIVAAGMFLTGSRSAILGSIICIFLLLLIENWEDVYDLMTKAVVISTIGFLSPVFLFDFTTGGGTQRISFAAVLSSLVNRVDRYIIAFEIILTSGSNILFGISLENYAPVAPEAIQVVDPHNIWISFMLYSGIPVALSFTILYIHVLRDAVSMAINQGDGDAVIILLLLVVTSIYSMFSGRLTRIFTIWVAMGMVMYQSSLSKNQ